MIKIPLFSERFIKNWAICYFIFSHLVIIGLIGVAEFDFSKPIADIASCYGLLTVIFMACNFCFLMPSIFVIAISTIVSFLMSVSLPLFLILSLFQILGAEISVLDYGFLKTLLACIVVTPVGFMNIQCLKFFDI